MANEIIVFSLVGCGHCKSLKNRLHEMEIPFFEIEITKNEAIWNSVVEQTGHNVLPTVYIRTDKKDEGPVFVPGRDYQNEDEIIKIIENYV